MMMTIGNANSIGSRILIFFVTLFLVLSFILLFYQIYTAIKESPVISSSSRDLDIVDDKLIGLVNWRNYYDIEYRLVKVSENQYKLMVRFDWNKFQETIQNMYRDKIATERAKREAMANRVLGTVGNAFNQIVSSMDQSTAPAASSNADVNEGELSPYQQSQQLLAMRETDIKTNNIFFGSQQVNWGTIDVIPVRMEASEVNDLYLLLDMIRLNMEIQGVIKVDFNDRIMNLEIPMIFVKKTIDATHLRFDPDIPIKNAHSQDIQSLQKLTRITEMFVYSDRIVVYPANDPTKTMTIQLK